MKNIHNDTKSLKIKLKSIYTIHIKDVENEECCQGSSCYSKADTSELDDHCPMIIYSKGFLTLSVAWTHKAHFI